MLFVKNMVCYRSITMVQNELDKLGLDVDVTSRHACFSQSMVFLIPSS